MNYIIIYSSIDDNKELFYKCEAGSSAKACDKLFDEVGFGFIIQTVYLSCLDVFEHYNERR